VHPNPCEALCDADQALTPEEFTTLMQRLRGVAQAVGRDV
jgi:3-deoxy-7-phosphoheptulonate synthase